MNRAVFLYQSGDEIKKGDRVLYHDEPAEIEFVADSVTGDAGLDWYVKEYGGGVMIRVSFGPAFLTDPHRDCDLEFVSRAGA
jgi:hypothetical protein